MTPRNPSPKPTVRVLIADDHDIVRVGLRALLDDHPQIEVVGEARDETKTLMLVEQLLPDVLLIDLRMPEPDGPEICRRLKARPPSPAILFLTSYADEATTLAAVEAGADGYLLKSFFGQDIPQAILTVADGGFVMDPTLAGQALENAGRRETSADRSEAASAGQSPDPLSAREKQILELLAKGRSNRQIAGELQLTEGTMRNYATTIFQKLQVVNRVEAAIWWQQHSGKTDVRS